jgi:hypothetical protein
MDETWMGVIKDHSVPIVLFLIFLCSVFGSFLIYLMKRMVFLVEKNQDGLQKEVMVLRDEITKFFAKKDTMLSEIKDECFDIKLEVQKHDADLDIVKKSMNEIGRVVDDIVDKVNDVIEIIGSKSKDKTKDHFEVIKREGFKRGI